jgi:hypothetical protein
MKKILLILALVLTIGTTFGQNMFNKLIDAKGGIKVTGLLRVGADTITEVKVGALDDLIADARDTITFSSIGVYKKDTTNIITGSYTSRHDFKTEPTKMELIKVMNKYGANIKLTGLIQASSAYTGSSNQMINERASYILAYVTDTVSVSTLYYQMHGAGSYTTDGTDFNGIAIYSISGTTATRIAITANTPTIWTTAANNTASVSLTAPVTLVPGIYYVGFLYCHLVQTTAPYIVGSQPGVIYTDMVMNNSMKLGIFYSTVTSFPASFTINSSNTISILHNFIGK